VLPGSFGRPADTPYTIQYNGFAGYCLTGYQVDDYRGDLSLSVGIQKEAQQDYVLSTNPIYIDQTNAIVRLSDPGHVAQPYVRRKQPAVGVVD
jgi:hypothetical protein